MKNKIIPCLLIAGVVGLTACSNDSTPSSTNNPMLTPTFINGLAHEVLASPDGAVCTAYFQSPIDHKKDETLCEPWIYKMYSEFMAREQDEGMIEEKAAPKIPEMRYFLQPVVWDAVAKEVTEIKLSRQRHDKHPR